RYAAPAAGIRRPREPGAQRVRPEPRRECCFARVQRFPRQPSADLQVIRCPGRYSGWLGGGGDVMGASGHRPAARTLAVLSLLVAPLLTVGHAAAAQAVPADCGAVREWVDYLNTMADRQRDLAQREIELTRDPNVSTETLADGLAAVAADREAANTE